MTTSGREAETPLPTVPAPVTLDPYERRLRRLLTLFLTILGGAAVLWLVWQVIGHLTHVLVLVLASTLLAFVLAAPVERLEARGLPRVAAVLLVIFGVLIFLVVGLVLLIGPLINQLGELLDRLPEQLSALQEQQAGLERFLRSRNLPIALGDLQQQALARVTAAAGGMIDSAPVILGILAEILVNIVVALVLTFYLLLDGPRLRHGGLRLLPERWRPWAFVVEAALRKVVGGYLRGQLVVALLIGTSAGVGCWLLGVPFPVVIGVLAGILELVPMLGPILASMVGITISLPQGFPQVLWVALLFLFIHQIELNILGPRIAGHAVGLHPAGALLALLVGIELGGLGGALLAVPTAGVLYVLAQAIYWEWSGQPTPALPRRPARLLGLARELAAHRQWSSLRARLSNTPVAEAAVTVTTTTVTGQAEAAERPEALVKLAEQARQLHVEFEAVERAREASASEPEAQPPAPGTTPPRQG